MSMMCNLFGQLSVGDKGHWKPWQSAAVMKTNAIFRLQSYLFAEGHTIFNTSRVTQDCLENLFSIVRAKQKRPTALQMKQHLRTISISQYMHVPKHMSYDVDERQYLVSFLDLLESRSSGRRKLNSCENIDTSSYEGNACDQAQGTSPLRG